MRTPEIEFSSRIRGFAKEQCERVYPAVFAHLSKQLGDDNASRVSNSFEPLICEVGGGLVTFVKIDFARVKGTKPQTEYEKEVEKCLNDFAGIDIPDVVKVRCKWYFREEAKELLVDFQSALM